MARQIFGHFLAIRRNERPDFLRKTPGGRRLVGRAPGLESCARNNRVLFIRQPCYLFIAPTVQSNARAVRHYPFWISGAKAARPPDALYTLLPLARISTVKGIIASFETRTLELLGISRFFPDRMRGTVDIHRVSAPDFRFFFLLSFTSNLLASSHVTFRPKS